jgi:hypothetical protein
MSPRGWLRRGGRRDERVVLVVSVDTECDKGPAWRTQFPLSFRSVTEALPEVLMPLFRRHGVIPTFLLSPEVIQNDESVRVLGGLRDCELGTHLHGEFIEPGVRAGAVGTYEAQCQYEAGIEREKLQNLTVLFEGRFGRRPTSFRAGRFAATGRTLSYLEELGYLVDSSVTPFRTNYFEGGYACNHWGAPLRPYRPSARDLRKRGRLRVLEVPVTLLADSFAAFPAVLLRQLSDRIMRRRRVFAALGLRPETKWLRPLRHTAAELIALADRVVSTWRGGPPVVLNVMFHSVEAVPGASPYAPVLGDVTRLVEDLARLFEHLRSMYAVDARGLSSLHSIF